MASQLATLTEKLETITRKILRYTGVSMRFADRSMTAARCAGSNVAHAGCACAAVS